MNNVNNPEIVSDGLERVGDAAKFLGVSRSFVYRLIQGGVLPSVKLGGSRRVPVRAVRELASARLTLAPEQQPGGGK
ncbi:MAG: helix-turn-helix domain-containing protein [Gemmataceae bacterium]